MELPIPEQKFDTIPIYHLKGTDKQILRVPDIHLYPDLKPVSIASRGVSGIRYEILKEMVGEKGVLTANVEASVDQQQRFLDSQNLIRLPDTFSAFYSFDTDYQLSDFILPESNASIPLSVSIAGKSSAEKGGKGVGKSTISAILAVRHPNWKVFSFEPLYEESGDFYEKILRENNWDGKDASEATRIINNYWQDKESKKPQYQVKSFGSVMEKHLQQIMKTNQRPEVMICDMPGEPTQGRRPLNVFDLYSREGTDMCFFTDRPVLSKSKYYDESPLQEKIEWIESEIEKSLENNKEQTLL